MLRMNSEIIFKKDIYTKASEILKKSIIKEINENGSINLGLPGGRSVTPILSKLKEESIIWEKVHVFMVDERLVPIDDKLSNFGLIKQELSEVMPKGNLHPFIFDKNATDFGLKKYEGEIKNYGGKYDIVLLSSGEDGHIASLFPERPALKDESEYYVLVENSPKPPPMRISVSKTFLKRSHIGVLLFNGVEKKFALEKFLDSQFSYEKCPAKLVLELSKSYVLTNINRNEAEDKYDW